jgi:hypothetical protein
VIWALVALCWVLIVCVGLTIWCVFVWRNRAGVLAARVRALEFERDDLVRRNRWQADWITRNAPAIAAAQARRN